MRVKIEEIYYNDLVNNKTWAVVHVSKEYMSYNELQINLVDDFVLGEDERHHHVFDMKSIVGQFMAAMCMDGKVYSLLQFVHTTVGIFSILSLISATLHQNLKLLVIFD